MFLFFLKKLNHLFFYIYKFIWNGGNDRDKQDILSNAFEHGGLRMFDLHLFSHAQKFTWVKHLHDPDYFSFWKMLEISVFEDFQPDWTILFRTVAPDYVLDTL